MERRSYHIVKRLALMVGAIASANVFAATHPETNQNLFLYSRPGFFRFSFDNLKMPQGTDDMGLLGLNYFADLTPNVYVGMGTYGAITGMQGGLFVLGIAGGIHHEFLEHWWADANLFVGGGGGKSSLVGGGLMVRPAVGISYATSWARIGVHYSYIDFPDGEIRSQQVGIDLDIPFDFYYVSADHITRSLPKLSDIHLPFGKYLYFQRNDFALLVQAYKQKQGTINNYGAVQDGTISLVGAELDHYITDNVFWSFKAGGAFDGIPNGYMDVLGGLGYHWALGSSPIALVPQFSAGAGGGGYVDTGGGIILQPQLGLELALTNNFSARVNGGYLWAPQGQLSATTLTGLLIYHLDIAAARKTPPRLLPEHYKIQDWRILIFNQTYVRPQRTYSGTTSAINLVGLQFDQMITPWLFFSYQAASAYQGVRAGGLASGMIGPGIQTPTLFKNRLQPYAELLVGAAGGGGLALGGGAIIQPLVGLRYAFTPAMGVHGSVSEIKALNNNLNTPVANLGLTINFGTVDRV